MSTVVPGEMARMKQSSFCSRARSTLGQGPIAELRKVHNPASRLVSRRKLQNRGNTVIVLRALAILTLVLGLLESRIRRLTAHSALSLSAAVRSRVAWRIGPVRRMRREAR